GGAEAFRPLFLHTTITLRFAGSRRRLHSLNGSLHLRRRCCIILENCSARAVLFLQGGSHDANPSSSPQADTSPSPHIRGPGNRLRDRHPVLLRPDRAAGCRRTAGGGEGATES